MPVKTGVQIIGTLHLLGLIIGLVSLDSLKVVMEFFSGITFIGMWLKDGDMGRFLYFAAYSIYVVTLFSVEAYYILNPNITDQRQIVKEYCLSL